MTTEKHEFKTTKERDIFLRREFPDRKALETPGHFKLPDGRELGVFLNTVTVYSDDKN